MRRIECFPQSIEGIRSAQYDLFVATTGFEKRSRYIAETIAPHAKSSWAPGFQNRQVLDFSLNCNVFSHLGFDVCAVGERAFVDSFSERVRRIAESKAGEQLRILVDISSMSRQRMAAVIDVVRFSGLDNSICIDFVYAVAEYDQPGGDTYPISEFGPVSRDFAGWPKDPTRSTAAIFGAGYEQDQIIGVVEYLEADEIWVFVPHGPDANYLASVNDANQTLWDVVPEERRIHYDVSMPLDTLASLESLLYGLLADRRPVVIPFGPKVFAAVAMVSAAMHYPSVSLWRVSTGQSESPINRSASGDVVAFSVEFTPVSHDDDRTQKDADSSCPFRTRQVGLG